jgi:phosphoglucosamine mutase
MKKLFGTDGMRGKAGAFPLDAATVEITGASLAAHLQERTGKTPIIVLGRDTRESGGWIEQAITRGATSAGAICHSAGVITTPGVAFLTQKLAADAGVVISASHNEYRDNGIKIFSPTGQKLDEKTESLIEADIQAGRKIESAAPTNNPEAALSASSLQEKYLNFLADQIADNLSLTELSIVVDCANGAASEFAPKLFERLNARTIAINCKPDGININRNCGSLHIEGLQRAVLSNRANIGVAFDGDADRALFVDETGAFVDGDATLWVLARYLQSKGKLDQSVVVATVMSNIGLEIALRGISVQLVRTDVGDKYVLDELLRIGASIGGEQSGHIIFPRISLAGDGMITALSLLRVIIDKQTPLSHLTDGMERYPQILVNVKVREKIPFAEIPSLSEVVAEVEHQLGAEGRLLLRYSGTESLARIMIEGRSQAEIGEQANSIAAVIEKEIGQSRSA